MLLFSEACQESPIEVFNFGLNQLVKWTPLSPCWEKKKVQESKRLLIYLTLDSRDED